MGNLAIVICATKGFQYALLPQARAIAQNVAVAGVTGGHIILATDKSDVAGLLERYKAILGGFEVHHLALPLKDGKKDYATNTQLLIAQLYTAAFDKARLLGVDYVWTLESDVMPEANNLRCMRDMLAFDGGYYDVSFCPYVSQGGGGIMGGRGSATAWIYPNWTPEETLLPPELEAEIKAHNEAKVTTDPQKWGEEMQRLHELAKKHPPKGNVFKLNSEHWRKRGWLEWAYPGIGKGAILPSDWLPMGNNLFSRKAITLCDWTGYGGRGTQDLYLTYSRLASQGLKFCVIPHSPSHHVVKKKNTDGGDYTLLYLSHETEGECIGHLRQREAPFYTHEPGERSPEAPTAAEYAI